MTEESSAVDSPPFHHTRLLGVQQTRYHSLRGWLKTEVGWGASGSARLGSRDCIIEITLTSNLGDLMRPHGLTANLEMLSTSYELSYHRRYRDFTLH